MLGVAGILFPALLTKAGLLNVPLWTEAGLIAQQNSSIPFATLLVIEHILLGFVEVKRLQDFRRPGSQAEAGSFLGLEGSFKGKEVGYPGGLFDPLGFSRGSAESFEQYKVKEIKNVRCTVSYCVTPHKCADTGPPGDGCFPGLYRTGLRHRQGARGQPG